MPYEEIEDSRIYRDLDGIQFVRAVDSVGANYAEAGGRFHPKDVINFLFHSRGSLRETIWWVRRAKKRRLITEGTGDRWLQRLGDLAKSLNSFVRSQRERLLREEPATYRVKPHTEDELELPSISLTNEPTS